MSELKPTSVSILQILHKHPEYDWGYVGLGNDNQLYLWTENGNWVALKPEPKL
jgi:hypothetical protein